MDLRAAIAWALETGDDAVAVGLVSGLWRFWQKRGYMVEGRQHAERVLAALGAGDADDLRVAALDAVGGLRYWLADQPAAQEAYTEALAIRRRQGDPAKVADDALQPVVHVPVPGGHRRGTAAVLDEAASILRGAWAMRPGSGASCGRGPTPNGRASTRHSCPTLTDTPSRRSRCSSGRATGS